MRVLGTCGRKYRSAGTGYEKEERILAFLSHTMDGIPLFFRPTARESPPIPPPMITMRGMAGT
jgi:hypothetical protein